MITDKLRSYSAAHRTVMPSVVRSTRRYENNRGRCRINPRANANDRCAGLPPPDTPNDSCRCTAAFRIFFLSAATCFDLFTTVR